MNTVDPEVHALQVLDLSARIVGAVHDDGPDQLLEHLRAVLALPCPPGVDPVVAVVAVLAAQIDPDTTALARLSWMSNPHVVEVRRHGPPPSSPCGTRAAYNRHRRHGEVPCRACMTASADDTRRRRQKQAAA